jgi:hypothetical protein
MYDRMIEWYRVLHTHFECSYCPIFPLPWDPKTLEIADTYEKTIISQKNRTFGNQLFPRLCHIYQHTIKMLWTSWMRHLWHFDRIQSTFLFYLHIVRNVSSIATTTFEAMRHAKKAWNTYGSTLCQDPQKLSKPIFLDGFLRVSTAKKTGFVRASKSRTLSKTCGKTIFSNCATGFYGFSTG